MSCFILIQNGYLKLKERRSITVKFNIIWKKIVLQYWVEFHYRPYNNIPKHANLCKIFINLISLTGKLAVNSNKRWKQWFLFWLKLDKFYGKLANSPFNWKIYSLAKNEENRANIPLILSISPNTNKTMRIKNSPFMIHSIFSDTSKFWICFRKERQIWFERSHLIIACSFSHSSKTNQKQLKPSNFTNKSIYKTKLFIFCILNMFC